MSSFALYMFVMLDSVCMLFAAFTTIAVVTAIVCVIIWIYQVVEYGAPDIDDSGYHQWKLLIKWFKRSVVASIIFILCATLIPSTKQAAFIYLTPKMIDAAQSNQELMKLPNNAMKLLNTKMEEYIQESLVKQDTTQEKK